MKCTSSYTKFVYPFNFSKGASRSFILRRLMQSGRWIPKIFDINAQERILRAKPYDQLRTEYFLPSVRKYLFPTIRWDVNMITRFKYNQAINNHKSLLKIFSPLPCLYYHFNPSTMIATGLPAEPKIIIGISHHGHPQRDVVIDNITLQIMENDIAFLILTLRLDDHEGNITLEEIMDFNYEFRAIEDFHPEHRIIELDINGRKVHPIHLINYLLAEFDSHRSLASIRTPLISTTLINRISGTNEVYDDRAFVYSFVCIDKKTNFYSNKMNKLRFNYLSLRKSSLKDEFNDLHKENTDRETFYARWKYSQFSFSKEGGLFMGSNAYATNETSLPRYFDTYYFDIFLLALYQRILLLKLSDALSDVKALLQNRKIAHVLKQNIVNFTNRCWFSQVTTRQQGMDLYHLWIKVFENKELFDEVNNKIVQIDQALEARAEKRNNLLISLITLIFFPITIISSLLGMNVKELGTGTFSLAKSYQELLLIIIGLASLFILYIFWDKITSKK